jgi:hypothetical protein
MGKDRETRIAEWEKNMQQWAQSDELFVLLRRFGGEKVIDRQDDFHEYIQSLKCFMDRWKFRKKQPAGKEHSAGSDTGILLQNEGAVFSSAYDLGMVHVTTTEMEPDYIVPLAGTQFCNLNRPKMAKYLVDHNRWENKKIAALAANRRIGAAERKVISAYASQARTEYDAIHAGLTILFRTGEWEDDVRENEDWNLKSCIRTYRTKYRGCGIYALAAPGKKISAGVFPRDMFRYFLDTFSVEPGTKILLVTSSVYIPRQLITLMPLALEYGIEIDAVGTDAISGNNQKAGVYLREMKSAVNEIADWIENMV